MLTAILIGMAGLMLIVYSCLVIASDADDHAEQAWSKSDKRRGRDGRESCRELAMVDWRADCSQHCELYRILDRVRFL